MTLWSVFYPLAKAKSLPEWLPDGVWFTVRPPETAKGPEKKNSAKPGCFYGLGWRKGQAGVQLLLKQAKFQAGGVCKPVSP